MPDQPADPIHYDMKIPPEPEQRSEEQDSAKKHGDKINTGNATSQPDGEREDKKPE
jgi:hypothetical protein